MDKEPVHMLGLKIPVSLWRNLCLIAAKKDVTVSNYVRALIKNDIRKKMK